MKKIKLISMALIVCLLSFIPVSFAQDNTGIDIINYVRTKVPTVKKIGGHRDFMSTACPGQYFPLEEMKTMKKGRNSQCHSMKS